jgi:hypothetical protein
VETAGTSREEATAAFDSAGFHAAKPTAIGRREGLPGEPEMVLEMASAGETSLWLQFSLEGGAKAHIKRVSWELGDIGAYEARVVGRNLQIVVQLPKDKTTRRTRVSVQIQPGGTYRFALNSGTFADSLKDLLRGSR